MSISLFIRSYEADFEWLKYSIRSMMKNLSGIGETVLVIPFTTGEVHNEFKHFFDRIFSTQETHEGYIAQQISKVLAFKYCKYDNILFSDSDCIYHEPFNAYSLINDNKCILYKTAYSQLEGDVLNWQGITEACLGVKPEFEYMRCFPIMHKAFTCYQLDNMPRYRKYIQNLTDRSFSEFNALGYIAETQFSEHYDIRNTADHIPPKMTTQYWSWGGITKEIREKLEAI